MKRKTAVLAIATMAILGTTAFNTPAKAETNLNEKEIEKIIENYLLNNGDKIMLAVERYQQTQQAKIAQQAQKKLADSAEYLNDDSHPFIGSKNADVTIYEFFDYNCGYCKRAFNDIQKITSEDKNVKFVFLEMPILGPTSFIAAQMSMAAHKQGKYVEYHTKIMNFRGQKTPDSLKNIAKEVGIDISQLEKDAKSNDVQQHIAKSINFAKEVGIQGTPAFIIDGKLIRGYVGAETLKAKIADIRKNKE